MKTNVKLWQLFFYIDSKSFLFKWNTDIILQKLINLEVLVIYAYFLNEKNKKKCILYSKSLCYLAMEKNKYLKDFLRIF